MDKLEKVNLKRIESDDYLQSELNALGIDFFIYRENFPLDVDKDYNVHLQKINSKQADLGLVDFVLNDLFPRIYGPRNAYKALYQEAKKEQPLAVRIIDRAYQGVSSIENYCILAQFFFPQDYK